MRGDFTDAEHREHCRQAGCKHPAVHARGVHGWCLLHRTVAFGEDVARKIEERLEAAYARKPRA